MKRILLSDDRVPLVELFDDMLKGEGYEVVTRQTPYQTAQEIEEQHPDLVVLGITNESSNFGRETLKLLQSTSIRTLAIYREPEALLRQERAELAGENITLVHIPFDIDLVLEMIKEAV